jgi:hypothetical protein
MITGHGSTAMRDDEYIELRVRYPGHPYVALLDGCDKNFIPRRSWIGDFLYNRREHLADGTQEQVYHLPLAWDGIYEVAETVDGARAFRYVAVCRGVRRLYPLCREVVEAMVKGYLTFTQMATIFEDNPAEHSRHLSRVLRNKTGKSDLGSEA